MKTKAVSGFGS